MLVFIIILFALVIAVGIALALPDASVITKIKTKLGEFEGPTAALLAVVAIGALAYVYAQYTPGLEKQIKRQNEDIATLQSELQSARGATNDAQQDASQAKADLQATHSALNDKASHASDLEAALADEQGRRRAAQDMVRAAWLASNYTKLSPKQQAEYDQLRDNFLKLKGRLTLLDIAEVDRPNIEGRKAFAIFEIYQKAFGADETQPRGAGLFDFDSEQFKLKGDYNGRVSQQLRSEITQAICQTALGAMVQGISLSDAINHIPRISGYDLDQNFVNTLSEFRYVQMQFQILAGTALVLVRGYADGERGPWRQPLGPSPKTVQVHENAHPNAIPEDYALTFRQELTPVSIGLSEKGVITYGNDDLPNLRAAETADILNTLINGCPAPTSNPNAPANTTTTVELLDGKIYPEYRKPDRRARVYLLTFLKEQ